MKEKELKKPKSCLSCEAVKIKKNYVVCTCDRNLIAVRVDKKAIELMNNNCPLNWK